MKSNVLYWIGSLCVGGLLTGCGPDRPASFALTSEDPAEWTELERFVAGGSFDDPVAINELQTRWGRFGELPLRSKVQAAVALLPNGNLLFCGGRPDGRVVHDSGEVPVSMAEAIQKLGDLSALKETQIFDPVSSETKTVASMPAARRYHRALTLADGRVFVGGGSGEIEMLCVYNPSKNEWVAFPDPVNGRTDLKPFRLDDGRVGLYWPNSKRQGASNLEVWDPATQGVIQTQWITDSAKRFFEPFPLSGGDVLMVNYETGQSRRWKAKQNNWADIPSPIENKKFPLKIDKGAFGETYELLDLEGDQILLLPKNTGPPTLVWDVARSGIRATPPSPSAGTPRTKIVFLGERRYLLVAPKDVLRPDTSLASFTVWDEKANRWLPVDSRADVRWSGQYFSLPDGRLLVAGGEFDWNGADFAFPHVRTLHLRARAPSD